MMKSKSKKFLSNKLVILFAIFFVFSIVTVVAGMADYKYSKTNFYKYKYKGNRGISRNIVFTDKDDVNHFFIFKKGLLVGYYKKSPPEPPEPSFPSEGLVAYYKFDEQDTSGSGIIIDSSGNGNDGINNGANNITGKLGTAYEFDGNNDYIDLGDGDLNIIGAISISMWIKGTGSESYMLFARDGTTATTIQFRLDLVNSKPRFAICTNNICHRATGKTNINDGTWHHIIGIWDGTTNSNGIKIYIENSNENNATFSGIQSTTNSNTCIATRNENSEGDFCYDGSIDEVGIWNRALSEEEIEVLYNDGDGLSYD